MELTFGGISKGDYVQCGDMPAIYHVEYIDWFEDGLLQNFKMVDAYGNVKKYSHLKKDTAFNNGSIVGGFKEVGTCECCGQEIK